MDSQQREREHFFGSAKLIAGLTILSRIAGLARVVAIATLGANAYTDAFAFAFKIPNLFRRLFAEGAMSAAFVPVLTETLESGPGGDDRAKKLFANATGLLALVLTGIMIVVQLGLLTWAVFRPGPADQQLLLTLTAVMLPFMITICVLALWSAALNCRSHFGYPAAAPILLNLVIVAGVGIAAWLWKGDLPGRLTVVAAFVTIAGVLQLVPAVWLLRKYGFPVRPTLRPIQPGVRAMMALMAPMLLGLGFLQLSELAASGLAWWLRYSAESPTISLLGWQLTRPLQEGVLPRIDNARYLYQFPLGVLAISLGVAVFPLLSRYAARNDTPNLRDAINRALRLSFMEGMATGLGMFLLAEPICTLVLRVGRYTAADVAVTADILRWYLVGMWAYCTNQILLRAFYALKDVSNPLKLSCLFSVIHLAMVLALIWIPGMGAGAFGAATAATFSLNALALAVMLRRRLGRLGGRKFAVSALRTTAACAAMAVAVGYVSAELTGKPYVLLPHLPAIPPILRQWFALPAAPNAVLVAVGVIVGAAVFIAVAAALKAQELGELFGSLRRRKETSPADTPNGG